MNILLIGSGAREHAIARALKRSRHNPNIFCFAPWKNPGIFELSSAYRIGSITNVMEIVSYAQRHKIDFCFIGPEAPLEAGVTDALNGIGIRCVGPTKVFAQIETSKSFARELMDQYKISATIKFKKFDSLAGVHEFIDELGEANCVVKADGLMGGKGVKVAGEHLVNKNEILSWCAEILNKGMTFIIEEKLVGQEFSLLSFTDGLHAAHMPPVQDHKRAFEGDTGPNTGGMGSYSDKNHLLPFLIEDDIKQARATNEAVIKALNDSLLGHYRGILYGGFMATPNGVKLIEYNARFGDPEAMNVLPILESDFVDVCELILAGNLAPEHVKFAHKATVCKYAVPDGYPDNPQKNVAVDISKIKNPESLYFASVKANEDELTLLGSRAIAVVGVADSIAEAERICEDEISRVNGPVYHRKDVGTGDLIKKKVEMMDKLREKRDKR